jgi:hypothetical protein
MKTIKNYSKSILFSSILLFVNCTSDYSHQKTINVSINNNIETAAILYVIADIGLNAHQGSLSYEVRQHFDTFKDHEIVSMFKELLNKTDLGGPIDFFLRLSKLPHAEIPASLDTGFVKAVIGNQKLDDRTNFINQFIRSANDFYVEADIEKFINDHKSYYCKCINDVRRNLPTDNFIPTMEKYYGNGFNSYNIIPSPILFPFVGFGLKIEKHNEIDIFYIAGPFDEPDSTQEYTYGFDSYTDIREMSVHEFGHSFINPMFELPVNKELISNSSYLFEPIQEYMSEQAYGDWLSCVNEHVVRLGEIRIALAMGDSITSNRIRKTDIEERKFIYLPFLEEKILEYENNRKYYRTFEDFFPELINVFNEIDTTK